MTAPGLSAGHERSVGLVRAIGEHLGGDAQPGGAACLQELRARQPEQISDRSKAATARAMAAGQRRRRAPPC